MSATLEFIFSDATTGGGGGSSSSGGSSGGSGSGSGSRGGSGAAGRRMDEGKSPFESARERAGKGGKSLLESLADVSGFGGTASRAAAKATQIGGLLGKAGGMVGGSAGAAMGTAGAAVAAAAGPIAVAAAALAAVGVAAAVLKAKFDSMSEALTPFSAALSAAKANNEVKDTLLNMERAERFGGALGEYEDAKGDLGRSLTKLTDEMLTPLLPAFTKLVEFASRSADGWTKLFYYMNRLMGREGEKDGEKPMDEILADFLNMGAGGGGGAPQRPGIPGMPPMNAPMVP